MPKMTQFCRHKIVIWTNKVIPKKLVIKNSAYLGTVSKVSLKNGGKWTSGTNKNSLLKSRSSEIENLFTKAPSEMV